MDRAHCVEVAEVHGTVLHLRVDGTDYAIDLAEVSQRFASASAAQCRNLVVSPSGYGIHWPELDEDWTVAGLTRKVGQRASRKVANG